MMNRSLLPAFLLLSTAAAQASLPPLSTVLTLFVISTDKDGKEVLTSASTVKPGLQGLYVLEAHASKRSRRVAFTVPVPAGTSYNGRLLAPQGAGVTFTLDGKAFSARPLIKVDGKDVPAPINTYRAVRFELPSVAADADLRMDVGVTFN